jgi:site-specific recombinase XerD
LSRRSGQPSSPGQSPKQLALPIWDNAPASPPPTTSDSAASSAISPENVTEPETRSGAPGQAAPARKDRADFPPPGSHSQEALHPNIEDSSRQRESDKGIGVQQSDVEVGGTRQPIAGADVPGAGAAAQAESGSTVRLSDLVPRFLDFATAIDRSPHTIQTIRVDLALLVRHLGNRPATEISLDDLRRYANWLRKERNNDPRSLRRKVASVKAFFNYVQQVGIRDDDPADQLIYPSSEPHLPEFLEADEAAKLVAAAERPMWRALIVTLLDTGLKRDELLALHPADVYIDPDDTDRGYLTVRAANQARRIRARTLTLSPRLVAELRRQIETGAGDRLFPISVRAVNAIVETTGQRAGLRKRGPVSPQMLRDTFAINEVRRRMVEEDRARRAGASDREIMSLRARNDLDVCDLLGLTPSGTNDPIARYRLLAAPGSPRRS